MAKRKYHVHPKALVDKGAFVGEETRIWAFAHVMSGAKIGAHCNICDYVFVERGAKLGDHVTVKNGVQIWEGVTAENGVFLGPNCVFTNDMYPRSFLKRSKDQWLEPTLLKEGCSIGANATIICGNTVGKYAYVAAGATVTKEVADYAMVLGSPAQFHAWICRCGMKLKFSGKRAKCIKCGDRYAKGAGGKTVKREA